MKSDPNFPPTSRRSFLSAAMAASAVGVTGCIGRGPASVDVTVVARDDVDEGTLVEESVVVEGGEYHSWELELEWEHEVDIELDVTEGPDLQVYLVEDGEMEAFREGEEFQGVEGGIWSDVSEMHETLELGAGDYWLVVVNDDRLSENVPEEDDEEEDDDAEEAEEVEQDEEVEEADEDGGDGEDGDEEEDGFLDLFGR